MNATATPPPGGTDSLIPTARPTPTPPPPLGRARQHNYAVAFR
jgi:hypothetical protein